MATKKQEWLKRVNEKRAAMEKGTFRDAPTTQQYVPPGQEWMAISLWGPQGPYARSNDNTVLFHGAFATPEEADAHIESLLKRDPMLRYVQTVVFKSGHPLPMPLKPTGDITRKFDPSMQQVADQWSRYSQHRLAEEEDMKQRVLLAKKHYKGKEINIRKGEIERTTADPAYQSGEEEPGEVLEFADNDNEW
jgi:hypothetical protein